MNLAGNQATTKKATSGDTLLGEGLPPMPAKLVSKIHRGQYVDMAELLLRDNMEQKKDEIIGRYPPMHLALISSQTGERYHTSQPGSSILACMQRCYPAVTQKGCTNSMRIRQ